MLGIILSASYVLNHLILIIANTGEIFFLIIRPLQGKQLKNKKIKPHAQGHTASDRTGHPHSRAHALHFQIAASFCGVVFHLRNDVSFCKGGPC